MRENDCWGCAGAKPAGPTRWAPRRSVEPTALVCLGLLASDPDGTQALPVARSAAAWLASVQNPDGSLGLSRELATPCWGTPHAIWLWTALGFEPDRASRAVRWLLESKGEALEPKGVVASGHDPTIVGWPWVGHTHSWLEPTALAVLALRCVGQIDHPRAQEGLRLIRDRAIPGGGWNYGNSAAFERELRPQPAPTGLALLALAGIDDRSPQVNRALAYLEQVLPGTRSAQSLAWGLLALKAWGLCPREAQRWLAEAYARVAAIREPSTRIAYLLLAQSDRSLSLLGLPGKEADHHG